MAKEKSFRILKKSPIVEATFQVNFAPKTLVSEAEAKDFLKTTFPKYVFKEDIYSEQIAVKGNGVKDPPEAITHLQSWVGVRAQKDKWILTLFSNGFALGVLKPYPTDEGFFKEIEKVLGVFSPKYARTAVSRIGLRFINRFIVDDAGHSFSNLFLTTPKTPSCLGYGEPIRFLHQDVFLNKETGVTVMVNQVFPANDPLSPREPKVILDIDASVRPNQVLESKLLLGAVENLRFTVNKVFFGSIKKPIIQELS